MRKKGIFAIVLAILSLTLVACANDTSKDNDRADDVNIEAEAEDTSNEAVTDGGNEENTSGKVQENISERVEAVVKEPYNPKYELAMGLAYTVNADGTSCTITGIGTCELTEFSIPEEIDGYRVTKIGNDAFKRCSSLESIEIPDGVTSIEAGVFRFCSLESIEIPDGVTNIGESAFQGCRRLTSIKIPTGVISIGESTFSDCSSLASIEIPDSVTSIGNNAFYQCDSLTSIKIPNGVTSIGEYAFYYCSGLTSIKVSRGSYAETWCKDNGFGDIIEYID